MLLAVFLLVIVATDSGQGVSLQDCQGSGVMPVNRNDTYNITCPHNATNTKVTWIFTSLVNTPVTHTIVDNCLIASRNFDYHCSSQLDGFRISRPHYAYTSLMVEWDHLPDTFAFGNVTCVLDDVYAGSCYLNLVGGGGSPVTPTSDSQPTSTVKTALHTTTLPPSTTTTTPTTATTTNPTTITSTTTTTPATPSITPTTTATTTTTTPTITTPTTTTASPTTTTQTTSTTTPTTATSVTTPTITTTTSTTTTPTTTTTTPTTTTPSTSTTTPTTTTTTPTTTTTTSTTTSSAIASTTPTTTTTTPTPSTTTPTTTSTTTPTTTTATPTITTSTLSQSTSTPHTTSTTSRSISASDVPTNTTTTTTTTLTTLSSTAEEGSGSVSPSVSNTASSRDPVTNATTPPPPPTATTATPSETAPTPGAQPLTARDEERVSIAAIVGSAVAVVSVVPAVVVGVVVYYLWRKRKRRFQTLTKDGASLNFYNSGHTNSPFTTTATFRSIPSTSWKRRSPDSTLQPRASSSSSNRDQEYASLDDAATAFSKALAHDANANGDPYVLNAAGSEFEPLPRILSRQGSQGLDSRGLRCSGDFYPSTSLGLRSNLAMPVTLAHQHGSHPAVSSGGRAAMSRDPDSDDDNHQFPGYTML